MDWEDSRDGWSGNPQTIGQRIGKIVIVGDFQVMHCQSSLRLVEVDPHGVASYWDHPKDVVPVNSHIVIMNLLGYRQRVRSNWNGIEVQSNETEGTVMLHPVRTDESALTEAHVGPER